MTWFYPERYNVISMLEMDNNNSEWIQKKNADLKFDFNDGVYNMFSLTPEGLKDLKPIYREGRLGKFFYIEGVKNPIDFRSIKPTGDPQLDKQLLKVDMSRMFQGSDNMGIDFLKKYWVFILIGLVALVVILLFTRGK